MGSKDILSSPKYGQKKDPTSMDIEVAFANSEVHYSKNVTTLKLENGTWLSAISGDHPNSYSLHKRFESDKVPEICNQYLNNLEVRTVFTKMLEGDKSWHNQYEWKENEYDWGKKSNTLIYIGCFVFFNIALITFALQKMKKDEITLETIQKPLFETPLFKKPDVLKLEIEFKNSDCLVKYMKCGHKIETSKKTSLLNLQICPKCKLNDDSISHQIKKSD